jgi:uncharacterized membrane protein
MTWFEFLLFVHVAMAVIWVGGGLMLQFVALRASMSGDPTRLPALGKDIEWIGTRVFVPASLLAFVSGILLVIDSDVYGFGDDWIVIGLVLYAVTFLAGVLFFGPESGRLSALVEQGSPEADARIRRLILLSRFDNLVLFLLVYDMTVKPEIDDSAFLWGVLGGLIAAGLIYWRYQVARGKPPPGPGPAAGTPTEPG